VYRGAGYATASFASNLFTGQFTNSIKVSKSCTRTVLPEVGSSKTSRARRTGSRWLERHHDVPFFAFVHLYDPRPSSRGRPITAFGPTLKKEEHEENQEKVRRSSRILSASCSACPRAKSY
jgi:hypothetical protein